MEALCKFYSEYFDFKSKQNVPFNCKEASLSSGYCIFHDDQYYSKDAETVTKEIERKLGKSSHDGNLLIIGYNIPVSVLQRGFDGPVYFNQSKFHGELKDDDLKDKIFHNVSFEGCEFFGRLSFLLCTFSGYVDFRRAIFDDAVIFDRVWFGKADEPDFPLDFSLATFKGQVKFHNPYFPTDPPKKLYLQFDYSKFEKGAVFYDDNSHYYDGAKHPFVYWREVISFEGVDLSNIEFSNYEFGDSKGPHIPMWQFFSDKYAGHLWIFFAGLLFLAFSLYYYLDTESVGFMAAIVGSLMGSALNALSILKARVNGTLIENGSFKNSINLGYTRIIGGGIMSGLLVYLVIFLISLTFDFDIKFVPSTIVVFLSSIAAYNINFSMKSFDKVIKIVTNKVKTKRMFSYEYETESVSEEDVFKYEQTRKIVIVAVPVLIILFVISLIYDNLNLDSPRSLFFLQIVLLNFAIGYLFRIFFQVRRKDFRYGFAKACTDISYKIKSSNHKNEVKSLKYLISGLNSYNKYLQKEFNMEIKELENLFSKLILDSQMAKQIFINSIGKSFAMDDKFEPLRYISTNYLNLLDTEQFLIRGRFIHKVKDFIIFLVTVIPVIISIVQLLRNPAFN